MRLVFMGTPEFALPSLRALVEGGYNIVGVYTRPDRLAGRGRALTPPAVKTAALDYGLPVFQPPGLRRPEAVEELASLKPDVIVVCAFGVILRQPVLDTPAKGVLNVHPSLLPRHRGASPIAAAILAGDEQTGVTIMLLDPGMDTGPILSQRAVPVSPQDTSGSLGGRLAEVGAELLLEVLPRWLADEIEPQPQDDSLATYSSLLSKEDGEIDWNLPAIDIWRRVRAFNPWPGAFTTMEGQILHIWEAWPLSVGGAEEPGTVLSLSAEQRQTLPPEVDEKETLAVQTGEGLLAILRLQRAGRRSLTAAEFVRGQRDLFGRRLGP
ncbi:MAG: methionyl-tRNA formyltransferase [Dehalococcoidia bacterium]|nr:MAG: methionyl-tRNA formyltransferase [Dehalococcoidia bacterium]